MRRSFQKGRPVVQSCIQWLDIMKRKPVTYEACIKKHSKIFSCPSWDVEMNICALTLDEYKLAVYDIFYTMKNITSIRSQRNERRVYDAFNVLSQQVSESADHHAAFDESIRK